MRNSLSPKRDARRKIKRAFWLEWTKRQFKPTDEWAAPLGLCSYRDRYIYSRAGALADQLMLHGLIAQRMVPSADLADEDNPELQADLQAAIAASLADTDTRSPGAGPSGVQKLADTNTRSPGAGPSGVRKSEEAGIPSTPNSSRAHRKKRMGT